jgi:hypothetical protein
MRHGPKCLNEPLSAPSARPFAMVPRWRGWLLALFSGTYSSAQIQFDFRDTRQSAQRTRELGPCSVSLSIMRRAHAAVVVVVGGEYYTLKV